MEIATALATKFKGAELAQLVSALQRQNQSDEERDQGKNGECPNAGLHGLRYGALQAERLALKGAMK